MAVLAGGPPDVRVAKAVATADDGTGGSSRAGERRTTVRGGRTFHDDGSCGGFAPLAGTATACVAPAGVHRRARCAPGRRPAHRGTRRETHRRCSGCADARAAHRGNAARADEPGSNGRPPAPPDVPVAEATVVLPAGANAVVPARAVPLPLLAALVMEAVRVVLSDVLVVLTDVLAVLSDGDPARRRTGDAAERIDAPAADAPPAATTVGDMSRSA